MTLTLFRLLTPHGGSHKLCPASHCPSREPGIALPRSDRYPRATLAPRRNVYNRRTHAIAEHLRSRGLARKFATLVSTTYTSATPCTARGDARVDVRLDGLAYLRARHRSTQGLFRLRRRDGRTA